ncbi:Gfo/Idh/MocA family protein [Acidisoma sp. S159]|uniref:Gfo/Idh/MocA family protein n=1 Tax=Acidisoma sp. S159 TaxID=1747225 RepID=UPI001C20864C|nr:Gfo/Idh/MocA family oxidoreductase [Acidisoma sp. S159]
MMTECDPSNLPATDFTMQQGLRRPPLGRRMRLGFVGGGRSGQVGSWHASGVRLSGHWDIVAGALSTDPKVAALSAIDWSIDGGRSYADYRAMAAAEAARPDGIEAVAICTPNWTHAAIATEFLQSGIDVILDKPMAMSVAEADQLVALQEKSGLTLALTYSFAHHAMVRQAAVMVEQGAIGRIRQAHVEFVQDWATAPFASDNRAAAWRQDSRKVGRTSAVGDIGTHAYHLLKTISGLDAEELRAEFHVCGAPKPMEDTAFVGLRLTGGVPGFLWVTQAAPGNAAGLRLRLFGEKGGLEWDQEYPEQLRYSLVGSPEQIIHRGKGNGMLPAAERLVHLPRGHGEALTDAWANLYAEVGFTIAARRAGVALPDGFVRYTGAEAGAAGVRFIEACANSNEAGGIWVPLL